MEKILFTNQSELFLSPYVESYAVLLKKTTEEEQYIDLARAWL